MKIWDLTKAALFILFVAGLVVYFDGENWQPLGSEYRVVDGDSLKKAETRYRLLGIDAPELDQTCLKKGRAVPCGRLAKEHLVSLMRGADVLCSDDGVDKHGRVLTICKTDGTQSGRSEALVFAGLQASINAQMVHDGWAVAYGDYKALEVLAVFSKRGLWALEFDEPEQWRRENGTGR